MIGIHAGAPSSTHVTRPGAASKSLAPNWRLASSQADTGGGASITATSRLCPPRLAGRWLLPIDGEVGRSPGGRTPEGGRERGWNTDQASDLVLGHEQPSALRRPDFRGRCAQ